MKKNNILISGSAALVALIAVSGIAMSTFAAVDNEQQAQIEKPTERRMRGMRGGFMGGGEDTIAALEAGDYDAWKASLPENCPMFEKVDATNFSKLVEASSLMKQARDIYSELGLNKSEEGVGFRKGHGKGRGNCSHVENE